MSVYYAKFVREGTKGGIYEITKDGVRWGDTMVSRRKNPDVNRFFIQKYGQSGNTVYVNGTRIYGDMQAMNQLSTSLGLGASPLPKKNIVDNPRQKISAEAFQHQVGEALKREQAAYVPQAGDQQPPAGESVGFLQGVKDWATGALASNPTLKSIGVPIAAAGLGAAAGYYAGSKKKKKKSKKSKAKKKYKKSKPKRKVKRKLKFGSKAWRKKYQKKKKSKKRKR